MSSILFDLDDDICLMSTSDPTVSSNTSSSCLADRSTSSSSNFYTSQQLKQMLLKNDENVRLEDNNSTKVLPAWWRSFRYISLKNKKNDFERTTGLIACFKCSSVFRYGPKSRAKHFVAHASRCSPLNSSDSIASDKLTSKEKNEIKDLYANWICSDLRPFTLVEDYGLERIASAEHGLVDIKELLPSRQTVVRTVNDLANKCRADLKSELIEPIRAKSVTIAPDFWSTKHNKQAYLGLNASYVNSDYEYKVIDLLCRPFNGTKLYDLILEVTQDENLSSSSESECSELDEEQQQQKSNEYSPLVKPRCKKISTIKYNAQKLSINEIPPEAKQVLFILKQAKKLVKKLLTGKEKRKLITDLNLQYLKQFCVLLKPFQHVIVSVQVGDAPSLYLVPMFYATLKEVLQSFELIKKYNEENMDLKKENSLFDDSFDNDLENELPGIKWFRERLLVLLNEMMILDIRQVAATLLHPRYRCLKKMPDYVKNQCYRYVRQQIKKRDQEEEEEEKSRQQPCEPPAKRIKNQRNIFARFESGNVSEELDDNNGSGNESEEYDYGIRKSDELDRYLLFEFDKSKNTTEPLEFWKNHQKTFPFLSKYARSIFSIPATTTNVEREFSTAGWILNERRTTLQPENLENI
ncbi:unnamed protein product [Rotaria sp. Silwood2]|nr:unnamed protein product [Rotaria sp. Silwood2]